MPCLVYHMIPLSRILFLENQNLLSKDIQSPQFYVNPVPLSFRGFPPFYASLYCSVRIFPDISFSTVQKSQKILSMLSGHPLSLSQFHFR